MSADPSSYSSTAASSASSLLASSPQPPSSTSASTPPLSSTNPEMPLPRATARAVPAYRSYLPKRPNLSWRRGFRTQPSLAKDQGPLGPGSPIPPTAGGPYEEIPNGGKKKRRGVGCECQQQAKDRNGGSVVRPGGKGQLVLLPPRAVLPAWLRPEGSLVSSSQCSPSPARPDPVSVWMLGGARR